MSDLKRGDRVRHENGLEGEIIKQSHGGTWWIRREGGFRALWSAEYFHRISSPVDEPSEDQKRKNQPLARGVLDYFPDALLVISEVSRIGNEQHNPGQPMHWSKGKSNNHADALMRHLLCRGKLDSDKMRHSAKVAWRALALLQTELEAADPALLQERDAQREAQARGDGKGPEEIPIGVDRSVTPPSLKGLILEACPAYDQAQHERLAQELQKAAHDLEKERAKVARLQEEAVSAAWRSWPWV